MPSLSPHSFPELHDHTKGSARRRRLDDGMPNRSTISESALSEDVSLAKDNDISLSMVIWDRELSGGGNE